MLILLLSRTHNGVDPQQPRIQTLHHPLDRTALSSRIRSLKDNDERVFGFTQGALILQQADLVLLQYRFVLLFIDRRMIEIIQMFPFLEAKRLYEVGWHAGTVYNPPPGMCNG